MVRRDVSGATRQRLIDAAAKRLWDADETELRIADICADTGLSSSTIYSNFRSRQGLIDATYLAMYADLVREYVELLRRGAVGATTLDSFLGLVTDEAAELLGDAQRECRRIRLRVATAAVARPELRHAWIRVHEEHLERFTTLLEDLQARGLVGRRLTGRQLAVLLEGISFGRAFDEISLKPETSSSWADALRALFDGVARELV